MNALMTSYTLLFIEKVTYYIVKIKLDFHIAIQNFHELNYILSKIMLFPTFYVLTLYSN
jgi:hypothetical protein